jgi:hypothetical protein
MHKKGADGRGVRDRADHALCSRPDAWHGFRFRVWAPHRGLRCMGNLPPRPAGSEPLGIAGPPARMKMIQCPVGRGIVNMGTKGQPVASVGQAFHEEILLAGRSCGKPTDGGARRLETSDVQHGGGARLSQFSAEDVGNGPMASRQSNGATVADPLEQIEILSPVNRLAVRRGRIVRKVRGGHPARDC